MIGAALLLLIDLGTDAAAAERIASLLRAERAAARRARDAYIESRLQGVGESRRARRALVARHRAEDFIGAAN